MSPQLNESDCSEALHRVFEYLDGEMSTADSAKIAAHLSRCAACLRQYDVDTMVKALVKRSCACEPKPKMPALTAGKAIFFKPWAAANSRVRV